MLIFIENVYIKGLCRNKKTELSVGKDQLHRNVEGGGMTMNFVCHVFPLSVPGRPGSNRRTRWDKGVRLAPNCYIRPRQRGKTIDADPDTDPDKGKKNRY